MDGQNAKLRGVDGIHFTKVGARKVAHFLESEIHRYFDKNKPVSEVATLPPDIEQAADDINAQIRREMGAAAMNGPCVRTSACKAASGSDSIINRSPPLRGRRIIWRGGQTNRRDA